MIRLTYRCLLRMHPPRFRERFAGEMLDIFDVAECKASRAAFIVDAAFSLLRQWLLRGRAWAGLGALVFAGVQFRFLGLFYHSGSVPRPAQTAGRLSGNSGMQLLIVASATGVVLLAGAASFQAVSLLRASICTVFRPRRTGRSKRRARARHANPEIVP